MKSLKKITLYFFVILFFVSFGKIIISDALGTEKNLDSEKPTLLTHYPAEWIDQLLLYSPKFGDYSTTKSITGRVLSFGISTTILPITLGIDTVYHSIHGTNQYIISTIMSPFNETYSNYRYELAQKSFHVSYKCLRGFIISPTSIVWRDVVSNHFLHPNYNKSNTIKGTGKYHKSEKPILTPHSIEELQEIVITANKAKQHLSFQGAGYSQGETGLPTDHKNAFHIDFSNIDAMHAITINPESKSANIGAMATWSKIQEAARGHGLAVKSMQASNVFSVGGSISINCHGWDHHSGAVSKTIRKMRVLTPTGDIIELYPDDEHFKYITGGLGLFGIIISAEIDLTENHMLIEKGTHVPINDYVHYFKTSVKDNKEIAMSLYRLSLENGKLLTDGYMQTYEIVGDPQYQYNSFQNESQKGSWINRVLIQLARNSPAARSMAWKTEKSNIVSKTDVKPRNDHMKPDINFVFDDRSLSHTEWLQEYFIPEEHITEFIHFLGGVLDENNVNLFNASVRFVDATPDPLIGYAKTSDRYAVVLFFNQSLNPAEIEKTAQWIKRVVDIVNIFGGSYYLPYANLESQQQYVGSYPNIAEVQQAKQNVDPNSVFESGFYNRYIKHYTKENQVMTTINQLTTVNDYKTIDINNVRDFLNHVFKQVDTETMCDIFQEAIKHSTPDVIYSHIKDNTHLAQSNFLSHAYTQYKALGDETSSSIALMNRLIEKDTMRNGVIEMMNPGRYYAAITSTGEVTLYNDFESRVQSGLIFKPYDRFVKLDYNNEPTSLSNQNVDVIWCLGGLHHVRDEYLDSMVGNISNALNEGGVFILREHDLGNDDHKTARVIHSIFNACTGVPFSEEQSEWRHFQSKQEWIKILNNKGLVHIPNDQEIIRDGDPSANTFLKFIKVNNTDKLTSDETLTIEREKLINKLNGHYNRPSEGTYGTTVEWWDVEVAESIENYSYWDYPYFSVTVETWKNAYRSMSEVYATSGLSNVIWGEYGFTSHVLTFFVTIENMIKGFLTFPFWMISHISHILPDLTKYDKSLQANETQWATVHKQYNEWGQKYAKELQTIPFYAQSYINEIPTYWKGFADGWSGERKKGRFWSLLIDKQSINNVATGVAFSVEMCAREAIATVINLAMGGYENGDQRKIGMILQSNETYKGTISDRYDQLKQTIQGLNDTDNIVEIAGNTHIQVDIVVNRDTQKQKNELYRRWYMKDPKKEIVACKIPVNEIKNYVKNNDINLHRIYDY
ncbi:FAD-binding protein [Chlamydiia bacterium]|nr:FAD-binding protein [Chlamydiia bacterium]